MLLMMLVSRSSASQIDPVAFSVWARQIKIGADQRRAAQGRQNAVDFEGSSDTRAPLPSVGLVLPVALFSQLDERATLDQIAIRFECKNLEAFEAALRQSRAVISPLFCAALLMAGLHVIS